jgi:hypothetical protein
MLKECYRLSIVSDVSICRNIAKAGMQVVQIAEIAPKLAG